MVHKSLFSSGSEEWETPQELFDELDREFHFGLDACASVVNAKCKFFYSKKEDGLTREWALSTFMNPPYGRQIGKWIRKAYQESQKGSLVVCLLPARTDTKWFHDYCLRGKIRFIKGRLYFSNRGRAPFPSMIVIFGGERSGTHN